MEWAHADQPPVINARSCIRSARARPMTAAGRPIPPACARRGSRSRSMIPRRAGSVGDGLGRWRRVSRCASADEPSRLLV
jgi:hypothetical protein